MAPVTSSGSPNDAFARVSAALLVVWPQVLDQAAGLSAAERSLLLDECGSDHRPLVELLLDIGRQVRPQLVALGVEPQPAAVWANTRAPLVHRLVATRYLQPDVARWAVDVWGRVLGVAPPPAPPVFESALSAPARGAESPPPSQARAGSPARPRPASPPATVVTPANVPAALRKIPSWAGGPVSPRVGVRPSALATGGRLVVHGAVTAGPRYQPVERVAAIVLGVLLVIITVAMSQALRGRAVEAARLADRQEAPQADVPMAAVASDRLIPVPLVPGESTPAPVLTDGAGVDSASGADASSHNASSHNASSHNASAAGAGADLAGGEGRLTVTRPITGSVVDAGVGGRYVVTPRVRDVSGTENCGAVAQALGTGRETLEVVSHQPGRRTFELTTRAVTGTLDPDGWFTADPRSGTTNNVNWQFRMRGRFGPDGFSAVSETYTEAILRWGRTQHCVVTAELTGRRLPG
jgi:hypothetical protein